MVDNIGDSFLNRTLGRRAFLKGGAEAAVAGATIILFGGCTTNEQPKPAQENIPPPKFPTQESKGNLPILSEVEFKSISRRSIGDTNRILGYNNSEEKVLENIQLVATLPEYQGLIAKVENPYIPGDEINRPAVTSDEYAPYGRKILLFRPSVEYSSRGLPNTQQGKQAKEDYVEYIMDHELIHYSAPLYDSSELFDMVYGRIFANLPNIKGKEVKPLGVKGAKILADVDGRKTSVFSKLEEAEAIVISDFVFKNRGRPQAGPAPRLEDLGYTPQITLLKDLLSKLNPDSSVSIKNLATLRTKVGGRETLCRQIGDRFKISQQDQLFFSLSVLYAIDTGDADLYKRLITR